MCGFVGHLNNSPVENKPDDQWRKKARWIRHRGPDDEGEYGDEWIYLGFRRLSVIDVENGSQPMSFDDGRYHIVFNGEIYNYLELRERLIQQGTSFQTDSDTEVVAALYHAKREAAVKELRGMFAFLIWDRKRKTLFAARDPFGIKPLYYTESETGFSFSSEKKCLFPRNNKEKQLSQEALQHYFSFQYVPEPFMLINDIHSLAPGHYLVKKPGEKISIHPYARLTFHPETKPLAEYANDTRRVLTDSVKKHMRSDVPIGAFLSGGIDSTSIVALAKQFQPNLKTFTVGFERSGFSEIDLAKHTAEKLDVEHIDKVITVEEFVKELPRIIWHLDEPVADPAAVPLYFVAKEASNHVKVVLSGEGADELFGGYNIYREPVALQGFRYLPRFTKNLCRQLALLLPDHMKGRNYLLRGTTPLSERYIGNANIFTEKEKQRLLKNYNHQISFTDVTFPLFDEAAMYDDTKQMQFIDLHTWLRGDILVKADRMTMAHSLELRVPFLDKDVFELARKLPTHAKIANGTTKYVLREAMRGIVPEDVLHRKKLGFPVPIRHWLRNELYEWAKSTIADSPTEHLLDKREALHLLEQHALGKRDYSRKIWTILTFVIWHALFIDPKEPKSRKDCPTLNRRSDLEVS